MNIATDFETKSSPENQAKAGDRGDLRIHMQAKYGSLSPMPLQRK